MLSEEKGICGVGEATSGEEAVTLCREQSPNVVIILADDMGYGDPGCYNPNSKCPTPNIDRLAAEGIRFNNAYATPLCTPTRVMVMSGLYPNRTGFRALIGKAEGDVVSFQAPGGEKTFEILEVKYV